MEQPGKNRFKVLIVKKNQQLKFRFTFVGDARATSTTSTNSKNISFKQILNNKATITTTVNHGFQVGQAVTIAGVDTIFNGLHTIEEITGNRPIFYTKNILDTLIKYGIKNFTNKFPKRAVVSNNSQHEAK